MPSNSMLSACLCQATLPSWWGQTAARTDNVKTNVIRRAQSNSRREHILKTIRAAGGTMSMADLVSETGWALMSLRNLCTTLVNQGRLLRRFNADGRAAYEVIA